MSYDVLIIDDEQDIRDLVKDILEDEGYSTRTASDSISAFKAINDYLPSVIVLDIWLQGSELDGLGILEIIKKKFPLLPVIVMSGHGTIQTAVTSIKLGAYDYIEKPFTSEKLLIMVQRSCESAKLIRENTELRLKIKTKNDLVGSSYSINQLKLAIDKVASTASRVLISGPAGSGKELVAKLIHQKSKRVNEPFFILNTSGINPDKINLELFGNDKQNINSYRRSSILEFINNGTLFIDEVADLPISIQNKLLKFLQDQTIEKNGKPLKVDVRVISSTRKNLQEEISQGRFREDLYYRLNVVPITVDPLCKRKEDIPILCDYLIKQIEKISGLSIKRLGEDAIAAMQNYAWPGNVRQLKNALEWLLIMHQDKAINYIKADMLPPEILSNGLSNVSPKPDIHNEILLMPLREAREIFEKQYLIAQMNRFNGNISKTSAFVGMERSALHRKLKSLNIHSNANHPETEDSLIEESS